jgi:ABC-2 type transport system permease protein
VTGSIRRFLRNVGAIAYKEAALLRHDRTVLQNVFMQPLILLFVFGFAMSFKPQRVPWVVLDRSDTSASRRLIADVEAVGAFLRPHLVTGYEEGWAALQHGDAVIFLVIPKDFRREIANGRPSVQLLLDGSDPLTAARVAGYVTEVAARFSMDETPPVRVADLPPEQEPPASPVDMRQEFRFNPTLRDLDFYMAALAGFLLTNICLAAASLGLVAEKENGTYEQMLAQPTSALEIIIGKLIPNVVTSYVALTVALIGGGLIYNFWPKGNVLLLAVVTLPFILATLGIGVFVSAIARTSAQAVFISVFFIMPSFVLSGSMLPYQLMPHGVREIGGLFPLRWYQIISRRIIERGATLNEVAVPALVLVALFLATVLMIRWRMKPRLG